jgi:hypothetical protein
MSAGAWRPNSVTRDIHCAAWFATAENLIPGTGDQGQALRSSKLIWRMEIG